MPLRFADRSITRLALIKPSALGDIVHSLPVLHALRRRFPEAQITWVVNRAYEPLLQGHPDLDAVLPFDRRGAGAGWISGLRTFGRFLQQLRRQHFDLAIDLQGLLRTGLMTGATGSSRRIGLSSAREGAAWFYTDTLRVPTLDMHAVDRYWLVAEALGMGQLPKRFHLRVAEADRQWAVEQLQRWPRPWIMVNLGTRWETKRWPPQHFGALVRRAVGVFGGTVVLVGAPEEARLAQPVVRELPRQTLDLTGRTTLRHLVAVLASADVVVSNDSGPLHLAVALGRPVVAPYTCTSPVRTGPYGMNQGAVETTVWCAASYLKKCGRMDCMKELTPDRLWPVLEATLQQWQRQSA